MAEDPTTTADTPEVPKTTSTGISTQDPSLSTWVAQVETPIAATNGTKIST